MAPYADLFLARTDPIHFGTPCLKGSLDGEEEISLAPLAELPLYRAGTRRPCQQSRRMRNGRHDRLGEERTIRDRLRELCYRGPHHSRLSFCY
jgi:hypothetical protein